jgi:hypothetical protein
MTATSLKPSSILGRAADLVDTRGLSKDDWINPSRDGAYVDETACPVCLLAAINIAAGRDPWAPLDGIVLDAAEAVAAFLGLDHLLVDADCPHEKFIDVLGAGWNDVPDRGKDEVVQVLRGAARREREAGR